MCSVHAPQVMLRGRNQAERLPCFILVFVYSGFGLLVFCFCFIFAFDSFSVCVFDLFWFSYKWLKNPIHIYILLAKEGTDFQV